MRWPLYFSYTSLGPVMVNVTRAIIALAAKAFFDVLKDTKEKMTPEDDSPLWNHFQDKAHRTNRSSVDI